MENEPAVIEKQMEETRTAMNHKLEALETKVSDTVQSTTDVVQSSSAAVSESVTAVKESVADSVVAVKESVASSVEAVKDTVAAVSEKVHETVAAVSQSVHDTMRSLKDTFNISLQMERHPWLIFGGSVGLGILGSLLIPKARHHYEYPTSSAAPPQPIPERNGNGTSYTPPAFGPDAKRFAQVASESSEKAHATTAAATEWIGEQLGRLKGLAVGSLMGAVRDMAKKALPSAIGTRVAEEVDSMTTKLGGEPIQGPVLAETK